MTSLRHVSVATAIEKGRIASSVAFVALVDIGVRDPNDPATLIETMRICANNDNITWKGNVYTASNFDFQIRQEAGAVPDISLTARDYTLAIQQKMQQYGGGIGFDVTLTIVNSGNLAQGAEIQETMKVVGASAKDYEVSFTLGAENPLSLRFPRRRAYRQSCPWTYKGAQCKYSGAITNCDYTFDGPNGCIAHANSVNFGGFPGIVPGIVAK